MRCSHSVLGNRAECRIQTDQPRILTLEYGRPSSSTKAFVRWRMSYSASARWVVAKTSSDHFWRSSPLAMEAEAERMVGGAIPIPIVPTTAATSATRHTGERGRVGCRSNAGPSLDAVGGFRWLQFERCRHCSNSSGTTAVRATPQRRVRRSSVIFLDAGGVDLDAVRGGGEVKGDHLMVEKVVAGCESGSSTKTILHALNQITVTYTT